MIPGVMDQAFQSILGNTERAVIEIVDYTKASAGETVSEALPNGPQAPEKKRSCGAANCQVCLKKKRGCSATGSISAAGGIAGRAAGAVSRAAAMTAAIPSLSELAAKSGVRPSVRKRFLVQFNPSELRLEASGSTICKKVSTALQAEGKETEVEYGVLDTNIRLTVRLIFDRVNVQDAFMWEKYRLDPTSLIGGAAKGIVNAVKGKEYTVQTETEGFLAALRSRQRRSIAFYWGDLCYRGILSGVESEYKMFSVSGKPVYAQVTLKIDCTNENVGASGLGEWEEYYDKVFANAGSPDLERGVQNVGNLLNIGF